MHALNLFVSAARSSNVHQADISRGLCRLVLISQAGSRKVHSTSLDSKHHSNAITLDNIDGTLFVAQSLTTLGFQYPSKTHSHHVCILHLFYIHKQSMWLKTCPTVIAPEKVSPQLYWSCVALANQGGHVFHRVQKARSVPSSAVPPCYPEASHQRIHARECAYKIIRRGQDLNIRHILHKQLPPRCVFPKMAAQFGLDLSPTSRQQCVR